MLSRQVFDVYNHPKFDESIQRVETRTHHPYVKSFQNNDTIEIVIQQSDVWILMNDALVCIEGTLTRTAGAGNVRFINNAGAYLFESIYYEINGKEVDSVRSPGIVSTLRGYTCYEENDVRHLSTAGWTYPGGAIRNAPDGSFAMWIPLKHLLGIFHDYRYATIGRQCIRLVRSRNDDNCVMIEEVANPVDATTAALTITSVVLRVKHVVPNDDIRLKLLQSIKTDAPVVISYRKWDIHELPALTQGSTKEIWAVKTCTAMESPRFVIVAFQTDRVGNAARDASYFDHIDITDIRLTMNSENYPHERMRLEFDRNNFVEAHRAYTEFYPSYANCPKKRPLLDYGAFKDRATVFVIDCSRRAEFLTSSTVDVKLDIESRVGFPANTRAYCIIIHDCMLEHLPLSEIVRRLS